MCGGNGLLNLRVCLGIEAYAPSRLDQRKEAANEVKKKRRFLTKNDFVYALHFRDKIAHELLVLELAFLGRLDGLVMGLHGLLQLEPQVFPVLPKGFDLDQPLFLRFSQPLHLLR